VFFGAIKAFAIGDCVVLVALYMCVLFWTVGGVVLLCGVCLKRGEAGLGFAGFLVGL
jgi:hypothetical protein